MTEVETAQPPRTTRVLISCTGVGRINRGFETYFADAYANLRGRPGIDLRFLMGAGEADGQTSFVVPSVNRNGPVARAAGALMRRNGYVAEQWSSFPFVVKHIRTFRPEVIFFSDANLGFLLYWFRKRIGVPYRLLYSNGGPVAPPYQRIDFVQQVAPKYLEQARAAGEPDARQFLVPYGFSISATAPNPTPASRAAHRADLGLPKDRKMVLSVGWISRGHKRMHYLVKELAALPTPRPHLVMLGAMDESSEEILALAREELGPDGFTARSVAPEDVTKYYDAADVFVLASLNEGFGRVYVEAMARGLPVLAHDYSVSRYILEDHGVYGQFDTEGQLTKLLSAATLYDNYQGSEARWRHVEKRFGWDELAPTYAEMFAQAATRPVPPAPN